MLEKSYQEIQSRFQRAAVAGAKEKNDKKITVLIDRSGQITRKHWRMATEGA